MHEFNIVYFQTRTQSPCSLYLRPSVKSKSVASCSGYEISIFQLTVFQEKVNCCSDEFCSMISCSDHFRKTIRSVIPTTNGQQYFQLWIFYFPFCYLKKTYILNCNNGIAFVFYILTLYIQIFFLRVLYT